MGIGLVGGGGKPLKQPTPTMTTSTRGPWIGPPWMTWCPPQYLVAPNLPPVAPTNRKSFLYPIYSVKTNPDAHVYKFQKAIQVDGERNDPNIVNLFCFTLRDAISKWGENFMQYHPECTFAKLKVVFRKRYRKVQTNKHVYMALRVVK